MKKVREFRKIQKGEGILNAKLGKVGEFYLNEKIIVKVFYKIHSSGEQELVKPLHISHIFMDFSLRIKI